jgi:hypothetical protein
MWKMINEYTNKIEVIIEECNNNTNTNNDKETLNFDPLNPIEEINIKRKFHKKLINLLQKYDSTFETSNIWMLNQLIIPLSLGTSQNSNQLKPRYQTPENDFIIYNSSTHLDNSLNYNDTSIHNVSIDDNLSTMSKTKSTISKLHIHTCYAFNQQGSYSLPLVVFPSGELDSNVSEALKKTTLIDESKLMATFWALKYLSLSFQSESEAFFNKNQNLI